MFRTLAGLVMAALWIFSASAQQPAPSSRLDDIIKRGTLRVGMTGDYLPFTFFDKATAKFRGFDVDMAEALGKALGVKVEFVQTAWRLASPTCCFRLYMSGASRMLSSTAGSMLRALAWAAAWSSNADRLPR